MGDRRVSSSEERKDQLGSDLVSADYRLNEELGELEEYQTLSPGSIKHWQREYLRAERALIESLGAKETVEYLQAKSKLMYEHSKSIS